MAIKKITVSFDLPIQTFLSMLSVGNSGMKIDVFGDDGPIRKAKLLNGQKPALLEGPKAGRGVRGRDANGKPVNGRHIMLKHFAENRDRHVHPVEFNELLKAVGLNGSASGAIHNFRTRGLIKRIGKGAYTITAKGLSEYAKLPKPEAEAPHG
jgi:hypothetical protein